MFVFKCFTDNWYFGQNLKVHNSDKLKKNYGKTGKFTQHQVLTTSIFS